jgi:DNA sulfur modification protein DndE
MIQVQVRVQFYQVIFGEDEMSYLPTEVSLSKGATNKFALIKQRTGITPNLMGRVALMKALESNVKFADLKEVGSTGQKIPKDIFFGEDSDIYDLALELYSKSISFEGSTKDLVNMLVDYGAHSIPTIKNISDLECLI